MTWSAALVPRCEKILAGSDRELIVGAASELPEVAALASSDTSLFVVYVDETNVVDVARWWRTLVDRMEIESEGWSGPAAKVQGKPLLVVVGAGGLRYEWQLRELGAIDVVGYVWQASRVTTLVDRYLRMQPPADNRWPPAIRDRLVDVISSSQTRR